MDFNFSEKNVIISVSHLLNLSQLNVCDLYWYRHSARLSGKSSSSGTVFPHLPSTVLIIKKAARILLRKHNKLYCKVNRTLQGLLHMGLQSRGFKSMSGALLPNSSSVSGSVLVYLSMHKGVWE